MEKRILWSLWNPDESSWWFSGVEYKDKEMFRSWSIGCRFKPQLDWIWECIVYLPELDLTKYTGYERAIGTVNTYYSTNTLMQNVSLNNYNILVSQWQVVPEDLQNLHCTVREVQIYIHFESMYTNYNHWTDLYRTRLCSTFSVYFPQMGHLCNPSFILTVCISYTILMIGHTIAIHIWTPDDSSHNCRTYMDSWWTLLCGIFN